MSRITRCQDSKGGGCCGRQDKGWVLLYCRCEGAAPMQLISSVFENASYRWSYGSPPELTYVGISVNACSSNDIRIDLKQRCKLHK